LYLFGSICDFLARNTNRAFNSEFSAFDLRISIKALIEFILNIALIVELLAMNLFYICDLLGQTHDFLGKIENDSSYYDFFKLLPTLSCLAIGFALSLGLIVRKVENNDKV
jgi:hypothetical protein